jgi:hypothetical protein
MVSYGYGCSQGGNVCDEAGRAIPAFGPINFRNLALATNFLPSAMVSEPYFDDVNFENISSNFPSNLTYEKLDARNEYILPLIIENKSYIRFMTWKVEVKADKLYTLAFGADGPFKFYFDDEF